MPHVFAHVRHDPFSAGIGIKIRSYAIAEIEWGGTIARGLRRVGVAVGGETKCRLLSLIVTTSIKTNLNLGHEQSVRIYTAR